MSIFLDGVEQSGLVREIVAGDNVTVDNSDPLFPIVSSTGGGGSPTGTFEFVDGTAMEFIDGTYADFIT